MDVSCALNGMKEKSFTAQRKCAIIVNKQIMHSFSNKEASFSHFVYSFILMTKKKSVNRFFEIIVHFLRKSKEIIVEDNHVFTMRCITCDIYPVP